jgi:hypothetical protein
MRRLIPSMIATAALMAACSTPYHPPKILPREGSPARFMGVVDVLEPARPVDVLIVHGMCTTYAEWATTAVQNLFQAMGGDPEKVHLHPHEVTPRGITLYQQTLALDQGRMRVTAIVWSALTTPLKTQLCYDESDKSRACKAAGSQPPYPFERALQNQKYKDTLLDDCLSDVLVYQGRARDQIDQKLQEAILQALATSEDERPATNFVDAVAAIPPTQPLVIITESLGSKMVFDAIYKMTMAANPSTRAAGVRTFARATQIFMYANQIPILGLADQTLEGGYARSAASPAYPPDPVQALLQLQSEIPRIQGVPEFKQVIAFTDPNDLLSFTLSASPFGPLKDASVVDVAVSNLRTYLRQLESPATHTAYPLNPDVSSLVACGNPRSPRCR